MRVWRAYTVGPGKCGYGGLIMLALVNVLLQHRYKDLGHLRDLQTHCTECTVRGGWCHFRSTTRKGESRQPQPSASVS